MKLKLKHLQLILETFSTHCGDNNSFLRKIIEKQMSRRLIVCPSYLQLRYLKTIKLYITRKIKINHMLLETTVLLALSIMVIADVMAVGSLKSRKVHMIMQENFKLF